MKVTNELKLTIQIDSLYEIKLLKNILKSCGQALKNQHDYKQINEKELNDHMKMIKDILKEIEI